MARLTGRRARTGAVTVIRKVVAALVRARSLALQCTVVWPIGKVAPEGGLQTTIGLGSTASLADAL
jgi:hypothetical protein